MKFCIIYLIVCTHYISGCLLNVSNELPKDCPYNLFRRKRQAAEYTRWQANAENSQEFLVKVLDEDVTTQPSKKIVAVNIQPQASQEEKIIIGGVMVPKPTKPHPAVTPQFDYKRFTTPLTAATPDRNINLPPPFQPKQLNSPKHAERDESPPAGPQFLPRANLPRQYAAITPVGFTRRVPSYDYPPVKPSTTDHYAMVPVRTTVHKPERLDKVYWKAHDFVDEVTRSTLFYHEVSRSTKDFDVTKEKNDDLSKVNGNDISLSTVEKDADPSYNLMIEYDDMYGKKKKLDKESEYMYEDKLNDKMNVIYDKENNLEEKTESENAIASLTTEGTASSVTIEDDDYDKETMSSTATGSNTIISTLTSTETTATVEEPTTQDTTQETIQDNVQNDTTKTSRKCSLLKLRQLNFNSPRTLPEIVNQLKHWAEQSPIAKWIDITSGNLTTMENPIYMMIIDDPSSGQIISAKQTVMIVAGIQGRDHHAVAAAMYVLYQLIERGEAHTDLLSKFRFWIIPVFNPDGYDYSMSFPHRRDWAKNVQQTWEFCKEKDSCTLCEELGITCTIQPCFGVNLDRNFEYQWISAEELRTEHPCGDLYAGPRQLSEAETRALTNFLEKRQTPIYTFIAFKEGETLGIMYPYSHTKKKRSQDSLYRQRATRAAAAAYVISGRTYVAGQTSEFLPLYAGGIEDWVDGHLGIDNTYTIMLFRPSDALSRQQITESVVHEAYAAMDTLVLVSGDTAATPATPVALLKTFPSVSHSQRSTIPYCSSSTFVIAITALYRYFT